MKTHYHWLLGLFILLPLAGFADSALSPAFTGWSPVKLRGYGTLAGTFTASQLDGSPNSVLKITCDNDDKARLVQAKYLSDLQATPEVHAITISAPSGAIPAYEVKDQGAVLAARDGSTVYILSAASPAALARLAQLPSAHGKLVFAPEISVPMYMDRWDQYGFRFYSYTWATPRTTNPQDYGQGAPYDFEQEFKYAENHGHIPFIFWPKANPLDTAEGLNIDTWWDWETKACKASHLPYGFKALNDLTSAWLLNRYRDQSVMKMPEYCGAFHDIADAGASGRGMLSYGSTTGMDEDFAITQAIDRQYVNDPNLLNHLETHNEMHHGPFDILTEYGPTSDASFRIYLTNKYKTLDALNSAWGRQYNSWDTVRVPEVASFIGWGPQAIDLTGTWRIGYEPNADPNAPVSNTAHIKPKDIFKGAAPAEWFAEKFDDSAWPSFTAPGSDRTMFLSKRPAVYRRTFEIPADWLAKHPRAWLDLWDLNRAKGMIVSAYINGQLIGRSPVSAGATPHSDYYEATKALRPGTNQISLDLPDGILAYRVYLSPDEPKQYPDLGPTLNAQWTDFSDWLAWMRVGAVERGIQMIRQVDSERPITLGSPSYYADRIGDLAKKYGGEFHNTGAACAFYYDWDPATMRGLGRPCSLETGSGATDVPGFKRIIGLVITEAVQGFDYFINIGDIIWHPDIKKVFEDDLRIFKFIGKYHAPTAEVAALYSAREARINDFPWTYDPNRIIGGSYQEDNVRAYIRYSYESDGLRESSFASGDAARYRVIIDASTSVMDESTVNDIEKYVRDGGVFVAFGQTGRHTSTVENAWPISRLTGYRVIRISKYNQKGEALDPQSLQPAPNQNAFAGDWTGKKAQGLSLEKVAPDVKDLMLWQDGSVAIGMRPLGKGIIVQVGCQFGGARLSSHPEGPLAPAAEDVSHLLCQLLSWQHVTPIPGTFENGSPWLSFRHYITNNGLYDVWVTFNMSPTEPVNGSLVLQGDSNPAWAIDVRDASTLPISNNRLAVKLDPLETRIYLMPRKNLVGSPMDWFELQRNWWAGWTAPSDHKLPLPAHKFSVDLGNDWDFHAVKEGEDVTPFAAASFDSSSWEKVALDIWGVPDHADVKDALLRKTFTVPATWTKGEPTFSVRSWNGSTFADKGRIWLDGKLISDWSPDGVINVNPDNVLKPGTTHTVTLEIQGSNSFRGSRGTAWLWEWPDPDSTLDLAGQWTPSQDVLRYDAPITLPGPYKAYTLYRSAVVPADKRGKNAVLDVEVKGQILGILINGAWISRFHHMIGSRFELNITPWVKFGEPNDFELVNSNGSGRGVIQKVSLKFFEPGYYP